MERQWKAEARRNELTELFRELQLLRLKYEHVIDVCRKLSRTWPNRGRDGKLLKVQNKATPATVQNSELPEDKRDRAAAGPNENGDSPELKLLDDILKRAKGIKLFDEELTKKSSSKRFATENHKKAAKIYETQGRHEPNPKTKTSVTRAKCVPSRSKCAATLGNHRHKPTRKDHQLYTSIPSKARCVKHDHVTSGDPTLPAVRIVKHTGVAESSRDLQRPDGQTVGSRTTKHLDSRARQSTSSTSSLASSVVHREEEEEMEKFCLSRDGSGLHMPSKYNTLRSTLFQIQEHISSQVHDRATEAMRDHFVKRLVPEVCVSSNTNGVLWLQLVKQEYQLLTEEFTDLSLLRATDHETQQAQDGVKEKMELIVTRASALEEELNCRVPEMRTSLPSGGVTLLTRRDSIGTSTVSAVSQNTSLRCALPMALMSLSELLKLVEMQHEHRMLEIEVQLLKFCTQVVLPKYMCKPHQRDTFSTTTIRILSELAGQPQPIFISDS